MAKVEQAATTTFASELEAWVSAPGRDELVNEMRKKSDVKTPFIARGKLRNELLNWELFLSLRGSPLGDRSLATGLQPPPHPQCLGLPDPCRVCGRLRSSGFGCASRT